MYSKGHVRGIKKDSKSESPKGIEPMTFRHLSEHRSDALTTETRHKTKDSSSDFYCKA